MIFFSMQSWEGMTVARLLAFHTSFRLGLDFWNAICHSVYKQSFPVCSKYTLLRLDAGRLPFETGSLAAIHAGKILREGAVFLLPQTSP